MCLKGQCEGYLSRGPRYPRRTIRLKVITCILVHRVLVLDRSFPCRKASMQITREEKCPQGVWIGVALTFGWLLGLAKIGHPPLHRLVRHIHSRVSCKGIRWGKTIFYRIFIAICAQDSATPATQHAGEGALPCGEDTGNRLRESQTQSAILHEKEEPEVTEPLNIISANCTNGCPIAENIHIPKTVTNCEKNESSACRCSRGFIVLVF